MPPAGVVRLCDVCNKEAPDIECEEDHALLCSRCDWQVHTANKVARRHTRWLLCSACQSSRAAVVCSREHVAVCSSCRVSISNLTFCQPTKPLPFPEEIGGPMEGTSRRINDAPLRKMEGSVCSPHDPIARALWAFDHPVVAPCVEDRQRKNEHIQCSLQDPLLKLETREAAVEETLCMDPAASPTVDVLENLFQSWSCEMAMTEPDQSKILEDILGDVSTVPRENSRAELKVPLPNATSEGPPQPSVGPTVSSNCCQLRTKKRRAQRGFRGSNRKPGSDCLREPGTYTGYCTSEPPGQLSPSGETQVPVRDTKVLQEFVTGVEGSAPLCHPGSEVVSAVDCLPPAGGGDQQPGSLLPHSQPGRSVSLSPHSALAPGAPNSCELATQPLTSPTVSSDLSVGAAAGEQLSSHMLTGAQGSKAVEGSREPQMPHPFSFKPYLGNVLEACVTCASSSSQADGLTPLQGAGLPLGMFEGTAPINSLPGSFLSAVNEFAAKQAQPLVQPVLSSTDVCKSSNSSICSGTQFSTHLQSKQEPQVPPAWANFFGNSGRFGLNWSMLAAAFEQQLLASHMTMKQSQQLQLQLQSQISGWNPEINNMAQGPWWLTTPHQNSPTICKADLLPASQDAQGLNICHQPSPGSFNGTYPPLCAQWLLPGLCKMDQEEAKGNAPLYPPGQQSGKPWCLPNIMNPGAKSHPEQFWDVQMALALTQCAVQQQLAAYSRMHNPTVWMPSIVASQSSDQRTHHEEKNVPCMACLKTIAQVESAIGERKVEGKTDPQAAELETIPSGPPCLSCALPYPGVLPRTMLQGLPLGALMVMAPHMSPQVVGASLPTPTVPSVGQQLPPHTGSASCLASTTIATTSQGDAGAGQAMIDTKERGEALLRYREKKKTRHFDHQIRYESRRERAHKRPRVKGRFAKAFEGECYGSLAVADGVGFMEGDGEGGQLHSRDIHSEDEDDETEVLKPHALDATEVVPGQQYVSGAQSLVNVAAKGPPPAKALAPMAGIASPLVPSGLDCSRPSDCLGLPPSFSVTPLPRGSLRQCHPPVPAFTAAPTKVLGRYLEGGMPCPLGTSSVASLGVATKTGKADGGPQGSSHRENTRLEEFHEINMRNVPIAGLWPTGGSSLLLGGFPCTMCAEMCEAPSPTPAASMTISTSSATSSAEVSGVSNTTASLETKSGGRLHSLSPPFF